MDDQPIMSTAALLGVVPAARTPAANTEPTAAPTRTESPSSATPGEPMEPAEGDPLEVLTDAIWAGPQSLAHYFFGGPPPRGVEVDLAQEMSMRQMFHAHEVPAAIANEVGRQWNQAAANPPTSAQLELGKAKCSEALRKMWGEDSERNLRVAQTEVQRMAKTNPEIIQMLEVSGLGNSPWLAATLFNLARARRRA